MNPTLKVKIRTKVQLYLWLYGSYFNITPTALYGIKSTNHLIEIVNWWKVNLIDTTNNDIQKDNISLSAIPDLNYQLELFQPEFRIKVWVYQLYLFQFYLEWV